MTFPTDARANWFRNVVRTGAFQIAYQPVVHLATLDLHHYEVLARFSNTTGQPPTGFIIAFAERFGLISAFDLAMCKSVLGLMKSASRAGRRERLAVNVSGASIASPAFVAEVHRLLRSYSGVAQQLMIEVTESARIQHLRGANAALQSLRRAGCRVCLDDLGAGASSFEYLRDLEVDVVKIDGSYVRAAHTARGQAFLRAMIRFCAELELEIAAEMIETPEELALLRECGVVLGQGHLFARPADRPSYVTSQRRNLQRQHTSGEPKCP